MSLWRRPNDTRLPILTRTSTSCITLIQRAFTSLRDCFSTKGANITAEVGLSAGLNKLSRGEGYECDEYCHVTIHNMTLYMYALPILTVLCYGKDVMRLRRHCNLARGRCTLMFNKYLQVRILLRTFNLLKLKLFTTCTVCAGLQQVPYATINLTCYTTRWYDFPRQTSRVASLFESL
jgi:hypothetical protein